jgi:hypothetical protein
VSIDGHETVLTFVSKDDAEKFAQGEHAGLMANENNASQRVREIAYRVWQEEVCPEGDALRHWFAAVLSPRPCAGTGGDGPCSRPTRAS